MGKKLSFFHHKNSSTANHEMKKTTEIDDPTLYDHHDTPVIWYVIINLLLSEKTPKIIIKLLFY